MTQASLTIRNVVKAFGHHRAVDGVTLDVESGECLALVGHNGAGKTTLFKVILNLLHVDGGSVLVQGMKPGDRRLSLGFLPENVEFQKSLTGREILRFFAKLKKSKHEDIDALLRRVDLSDVGERRVGTYSKGMRQRLGLAQTLIGNPKLLILDEPTSGLDPSSRRAFYALLDELRDNGTTILLSSHALSEVEAYTNRVAIMRQGRLLADGPMNELAHKAGLPVRIDVMSPSAPVQTIINGYASASIEASRDKDIYTIQCLAEHKLAVLKRIAAQDSEVRDIRIHQPTLDDIYEHFQSNLVGEEAP